MAQERSGWFYFGVGCIVLFLLAIVVVVAGGFWLYRGVKRLEAEVRDPVARTAKVQKILGADGLPEGYNAMMAMSVPFVMDLAILTDAEPASDGAIHGFGQRGLIYIQLVSMGQDEQELRDFFEGKTSDPRVLSRNNINIDADEVITRGVLPVEDATLMYIAQRGSVATHGYSAEGVTSIILIDCPADGRSRTAIWFGPDPSPGTPAAELDLAGTPADETAIAEFMRHFHVCPPTPDQAS